MRPEFAGRQLAELTRDDFEVWAKESFEIAKKISYSNGARAGHSEGRS